MKITKKETYNKNKSSGINEKLISEYYDIIPHMENEIENLLKKFNVKKYDHKITTLLIDIIQNETLKILLSSKKIQKKTNAKTNSDKPDFNQKNQDNQNNIPNQVPNTTSQEIEKKETIDDSFSHPNDESNYIFKADSFDQKNEGSQNSPNIDNLIQPENVESISKNTQSASEENVGNAENTKNDQSKENEMEKNSEETQTKEEEKSGGLFKTISSFFSKKDNEEKQQEDSEKIEDPSKDTKLNTDDNSIQNEKENLVNDTIQLDDPNSDEKNEENSSLLASNDKLGETQEMETAKDNSNNNNYNKIRNAENINEKNNASEENLDKINYDIKEQTNNNNANNNPNEQEEAEEDVLIIDEESVNQAIREYALKYIYRKKNVDFVYDDPTYEQKDINNVFVDRNIKYPMGFPPHLPDDCSINTILPSWNIQYDFTKKNKNNQYRQ
ncbi:conserved Plasmodium protein, unknown function [Plasmodium vinckei vinckei]|uniref:Uncharacterized protein n=1 Tax=Plasmodium vinckei vinckei TaxID=54757 RepID=A0A081ICA0_PLAVN|nr:conserved Plasmodium protein, unknown function [Plasmodium vinckei vinckei]KEG01308.1 hypothetical protein YYE_03896 [Plasmodium vinckei vinckei]VEV55285.1 conserved Plasmodium protein, unknown function [Plasmodium vinckei vinckei]